METVLIFGWLSLAANVWLAVLLRRARRAVRVLASVDLAPYVIGMRNGGVVRVDAANAYAEGNALYVVDANDHDLLVMPWDDVASVRARNAVVKVTADGN